MIEQQRIEIHEYLNKCVQDEVFPGANVLVYESGEATFFSVGNKRLIPYVECNSLSTVYDIASLSKVVSTMQLIMMAVEEEKIELKTSVASILHDFKHKKITIFDLCTHTSGLPADTRMSLNEDKESIRKIVYTCDTIYERGSAVVYSDLGFILLGFILEELYGAPLNEIAQKKVFQPLDMKKTMYCPSDEVKLDCAPTEDSPHFQKLICGEVHDRKAHLMNGVSGHAGVFTTIQDMSHFVEMMLHKGIYKERRILSEESIAAYSKVVTPAGSIARSLGFLCFDKDSPFALQNSKQAFLHTGFAGTSILIDPEYKVGIVILSNRIHPSRENDKIIGARKEIHTKIFDILNYISNK